MAAKKRKKAAKKAPAADADEWQNVTDKLQHLQR